MARYGKTLKGSELWDQCTLVVDATGVGIPVIEMLRGAKMGCEVLAVTITGGEGDAERAELNVPKKDLMAGVQVLLEEGRLRIAKDLPEAGWLVKELVDVRVKQKSGGRVRMGADGFWGT